MAYAETPDVKARSGRVAFAWTDSSSPSLADVERFLDDGAALIDAAIASRGYTVPATDPTVVAALRPVNAAYAAARALDSTLQGGDASGEVATLRDAQEGEWDAWLKSVDDDDSIVIQILSNTNAGPLATNFWSEEPDYARQPSAFPEDDNYRLAPYVARGDRF